MPSARRRRAGQVLAGLASVTLFLAVLVGYGQHAFGNANEFANGATDALHDQNVRNIVATRFHVAVPRGRCRSASSGL